MTSTTPDLSNAHLSTPTPASTWAVVLTALLGGRDLTRAEAGWAMREVIGGRATSAQIAGFLIGLRAKGETAAELDALVSALHEESVTVTIPGPTVDIAGTGGDGTGAVNISTMAAIVAAATGVTVVKHGGRAASSSTAGSADVLEHLGVRLELTGDQAARLAAEAGITFLFAPAFSPGLRHATTVRRQLAVPTVFNVLGPLINPARPVHQVVGVADATLAPVVAAALAARGRSALIVRGDDGLDNLTTTTTSRVWVPHKGGVTTVTVDPGEFGIARADPADLRGGDAPGNARIVRALLAGRPGPVRDVVLLNAAAVLTVASMSERAAADHATGAEQCAAFPEHLAAALVRCAEAIDTGSARTTLDRWVSAGRRLVPDLPPPSGRP